MVRKLSLSVPKTDAVDNSEGKLTIFQERKQAPFSVVIMCSYDCHVALNKASGLKSKKQYVNDSHKPVFFL